MCMLYTCCHDMISILALSCNITIRLSDNYLQCVSLCFKIFIYLFVHVYLGCVLISRTFPIALSVTKAHKLTWNEHSSWIFSEGVLIRISFCNIPKREIFALGFLQASKVEFFFYFQCIFFWYIEQNMSILNRIYYCFFSQGNDLGWR